MEWVLLVLLALYPCELSESDAPNPSRGGGSQRLPERNLAKPGLQNQSPSAVDKKLFLRRFSSQAGPELMPCLRQSFGESGSVAFLARLHKSGSLSGVRLLKVRKISGDCAVSAIEKMGFADVASSLQDESVEINWRFDW